LKRGFVQVYTGDGKGKSTAAFGLALRAAGAGLRVFIAQFLKQGRYAEVEALERFSDHITVKQYGGPSFVMGEPGDEDRRAAQVGLDEVRAVFASGEYQVVILDEGNVLTHLRVVPVEDLLGLIDLKPEGMELVITGRNADPKVLDRADLVTEMRDIKHYYREGVPARRGIER
jgi:cob(I)alamin adenosyltransferase